ncbi:polysaccharide pyruvyl transferase [Streptomyces sp. Ru73]|uniref:polysaccharide pyruvyl transferase family protein n=1 Tax=Streptomyces sp. Ru73 TaxID=2080748 RepID=UPI000CDD3ADC|nr:polysaccharide pyruvyl transferase family protein [Streptomyces sp. Ru73]POX39353.1 polysaccharide pyruvyl transferase [Streptomyces sp. Ru73]
MHHPLHALTDDLLARPGGPGRTLLTGWFSFDDGEVTVGDALAQRRVSAALTACGIPHDTAWSRGFAPDRLPLDEADPAAYGHVLFACGPAHGEQVRRLHRQFAGCRRLAVGVSVIDPGDPAVTGFDRVFARDEPAGPPAVDLAASAPVHATPPVAGVMLTYGQGEYGERRRHDTVGGRLTEWLTRLDCTRVAADTRLAIDDWRHCATPEQFMGLAARLDAVITNRLHGMVLALRAGTPALVVDPVQGGAKVSAQARALRWPAVLPADDVTPKALDRWWEWCLSPAGRAAAARRARLMDRAHASDRR